MTFAAAAKRVLRWLAPRRRFPTHARGLVVPDRHPAAGAGGDQRRAEPALSGLGDDAVPGAGQRRAVGAVPAPPGGLARAPSAIHAGTPYLMGISLSNRKRRLPSFSVEVEDLVAGRPLDKRCYFLKLPAGRTQETAYRHQLARRGRHQLTGFRLSTKFPFGLIQKSRDVADAHELLIYPALVKVPEALLRGFPATHGLGRHKWRSRSGEFAGLRDFRPGDDPRDIHWRTTARRGVPLVRESEDDEGLEATVLFDNRLGDRRPDAEALRGGGVAGRRRWRRCCSSAATGSASARAAPRSRPTAGAAQRSRILGFLALVEPAKADAAMQGAGRRGARIQIRVGLAPIVETGSAHARPDRTAGRARGGAKAHEVPGDAQADVVPAGAERPRRRSPARTRCRRGRRWRSCWSAGCPGSPTPAARRRASSIAWRLPLRAAVVAVFLLSAWQVWRRLARSRPDAGVEPGDVPAGLQAVPSPRQPRLPAHLHPVVPDRARRGGDGAELSLRGGVRALRRAGHLDADPLSPAARDGRELPHQALEPGAEPEGRREPHPELAARGRGIVPGVDRPGRAGGVRAARWRRSRSCRASAPASSSAARARRATWSASPTRWRWASTGSCRPTTRWWRCARRSPRSPRCRATGATARSSASTGAAPSTTRTTAGTGSARGSRSCAPTSSSGARATCCASRASRRRRIPTRRARRDRGAADPHTHGGVSDGEPSAARPARDHAPGDRRRRPVGAGRLRARSPGRLRAAGDEDRHADRAAAGAALVGRGGAAHLAAATSSAADGDDVARLRRHALHRLLARRDVDGARRRRAPAARPRRRRRSPRSWRCRRRCRRA